MIHPLFFQSLSLANPSWRPVLSHGLETVQAADPGYLPSYAQGDFLPTKGRIFAAFRQPLCAVRYVLVGEEPCPREESATATASLTMR